MNTAYLLIGGNEGDRVDELRQARDRIADSGCRIIRSSSLYETAAWGKTDQSSFLNQALQVATDLDPLALLKVLLTIEEKMGRIRAERYGSRLIDLDILFFNDAILHRPELVIPHPQIPNRRFVLAPMNEIAAGLVHPVLGRTIGDLLATCPDPLEVQKLTDKING